MASTPVINSRIIVVVTNLVTHLLPYLNLHELTMERNYQVL